jgi:hypothetical protein
VTDDDMQTDPAQRRRRPPATAGPGAPRRPARRVRNTMSATAAWKSTLLALAVFAVLGSGGLRDSAEGMPLGWQRDVALVLTGGLDRVVNLLSLNRPYDWAAEELGRTQADEDFEFPVPTTTPSATTTTLPPLRVPTAEAPLNVVIAGDSTAIGVGDRLKVAVDDDPTLAVDVQGKVATGLTRSDYFNWGARTKELLETLDPDVLLFMVGANDTQAVLAPDGTILARYGTPEWAEEYRRQVAGIMDLAHVGSRRVLWVGQPKVGDSKINATLQQVNQIVQEEASSRPWVTYFDLASVVAGPSGSFAEYVTFPDGKTVHCFAGDGVHLSLQCLDRSMAELVPVLRGLYEPAQADATGSGDQGPSAGGGDQPPTTAGD